MAMTYPFLRDHLGNLTNSHIRSIEIRYNPLTMGNSCRIVADTFEITVEIDDSLGTIGIIEACKRQYLELFI